MGANEDHGAGEIAVEHARHGDQELTIEQTAFTFLLERRHHGFSPYRSRSNEKRFHPCLSGFRGFLWIRFLTSVQDKMILGQWRASFNRARKPISLAAMKYHRRLQNVTHLAVLASLAGYFFAGSIAYAATSEWISSEGGDVRIVAVRPRPDSRVPAILHDRVPAILDIRLKPGWKTYWKEPGASGIPPQVTIGPSSGVTISGLSFPAPKTFNEGVARFIGYDQSVAFPIGLRSETKGDITLKGSIFIGICKDICIPVQGNFTVSLPADQVENPLERARIEKAFEATGEVSASDFKLEAHWFDKTTKRMHLSIIRPGPDEAAPEIFISSVGRFRLGEVENIVTKNGVTTAEIPYSDGEIDRGQITGSINIVVRVGERSMQTTIFFE
ncbi:protein-disulfide reductase DsbD domain-containing protein [Rhizobium sp. Leaf391]|nr:protein-disulfide reductase DsbD domain-containing protein [Rhizobium sp. Leaf391]